MAKSKKIPTQTPSIGFQPPDTLKIKSDGNILKYCGKDGEGYKYIYVKSETKLGQTLPLTEPEINNILKTQTAMK